MKKSHLPLLMTGALMFSGALLPSLLASPLLEPGSSLELVQEGFGLADGPAWDGSKLWFPDVKGEALYQYQPRSGKVTVVQKDIGRISAAFYNLGRLYLSDNGRSEISLWEGGALKRMAGEDPNAQPPARPNDLVVDHSGGLYYTLTRQGQVVYVSPEGERKVVLDAVDSPNGIILSPDQKTLYVASYVPKKILAFPLNRPGQPGEGRVWAAMDPGEAKGADGMTVDTAGNVYCAGPDAVWIWNPQGKLLEKITTPTRPINCAFGDSDMRTLYITGFGGLYRQRMNVYGIPPHPPTEVGSIPEGKPSTVIPEGIQAYLDLEYGRAGSRVLLSDLFVPEAKAGQLLPAIVVVHGGGWLNGDKVKFRALSLELAQRGYATLAVGYRLGHEALFPAGIQDCNAAMRFLRARAGDYGVDPERIFAVGGSAGGHLVGLMATAWDEPALQGSSGHAGVSSRPRAAIVMAGPMQMITGSVAERSRTVQPRNKSNSNVWLGGTIDEKPDLYRLADAYEHIDSRDCPILFMVGEHDQPERNEPSREKLRQAGVDTGVRVYAGGKHGCWNQLPWLKDMAADMDRFFRSHF